ncbi:ATPase WRNIP1 [Hydra vulgaris]|nr:ATPase WRNIP1 [Hydra vulgaris]
MSIQCPICLQHVVQTDIEVHVEKCLEPQKKESYTLRQKSSSIVPSDVNPFFKKKTPIKRKSTEKRDFESNDKKKKKKTPLINSSTHAKPSIRDILDQNNNNVSNTEFESFFSSNEEKENKSPVKLEAIGSNFNEKFDENNFFPISPDSFKPTKYKKEIGKLKSLLLGDIPLAEQMRPNNFDNFYGQNSFGAKNLLKELFVSNKIPSLILWGPPGCGKTSFAHIISRRCKESDSKYRFVTLSATMAGINDVKDEIKVAKNEKKLTSRKTVLFIDEIHRFNKMQQDTFLPYVEDGTIVLIGATTENPSFYINNALISRCHVVVFNSLETEVILKILQNAIELLNETDQEVAKCRFEEGALNLVAQYANGDARCALNKLDMILQAKKESIHVSQANSQISCELIREELQRCCVNYDKAGDEHYNLISALHKSIRGSDVDASIYWLARMLEGGEKPLYIARRLIRIASEDIGLADSNALPQAVSAYQACHFIGMPECDIILAQVVVYLANAPKSIAVYEAYKNAKDFIKNCSGSQPEVPLHLRNAPTKLMENLGYGKDYKYTPLFKEDPMQEYLPKSMLGKKFFNATEEGN